MIISLGKEYNEIDKKLISLRKSLDNFIKETGITKKKVAELLGLNSYRNVNDILEGKEEITLKCAIGIASLTGITSKELLDSVYQEVYESKALDV